MADVEATRFTQSESELVTNAEQMLIADCMRSLGFDYQIVEPTILPDSIGVRAERRWGPIDLSSVEQYGYAIPGEMAQMQSRADQMLAEQQEFIAAMSETERDAYFTALDGNQAMPVNREVTIPGTEQKVSVTSSLADDSCTGKAQQRLAGVSLLATGLSETVARVSFAADSQALVDDDFVDALDEWSACFESKGFEGADPLAAVDRYFPLLVDDAPSEDQIAAAAADVSCKDATNLWPRWRAALDKAFGSTSSDSASMVAHWAQLKGEIVANAAIVIASADAGKSNTEVKDQP